MTLKTYKERVSELEAEVDRLNTGLAFIHINLELKQYSEALEAAILLAKGGDIRDKEDVGAIEYATDKSHSCSHGFFNFDDCPDCRH